MIPWKRMKWAIIRYLVADGSVAMNLEVTTRGTLIFVGRGLMENCRFGVVPRD